MALPNKHFILRFFGDSNCAGSANDNNMPAQYVDFAGINDNSTYGTQIKTFFDYDLTVYIKNKCNADFMGYNLRNKGANQYSLTHLLPLVLSNQMVSDGNTNDVVVLGLGQKGIALDDNFEKQVIRRSDDIIEQIFKDPNHPYTAANTVVMNYFFLGTNLEEPTTYNLSTYLAQYEKRIARENQFLGINYGFANNFIIEPYPDGNATRQERFDNVEQVAANTPNTSMIAGTTTSASWDSIENIGNNTYGQSYDRGTPSTINSAAGGQHYNHVLAAMAYAHRDYLLNTVFN